MATRMGNMSSCPPSSLPPSSYLLPPSRHSHECNPLPPALPPSQVSFLRKVEQAEAATLYPAERGGVVPLRRYKGDMTRRFNLGGDEEGGGGDAQQQVGEGVGVGASVGVGVGVGVGLLWASGRVGKRVVDGRAVWGWGASGAHVA